MAFKQNSNILQGLVIMNMNIQLSNEKEEAEEEEYVGEEKTMFEQAQNIFQYDVCIYEHDNLANDFDGHFDMTAF